MHSEINALAKLTLGGDSRSQRVLVNAVTLKVFPYLAARFGVELATEAVQKAWVAFYGDTDKYDITRDFLPWFRTIALRMVVNDIRSRHPERHEKADLDSILRDDSSIHFEELDNDEWRERVESCWRRLSQEHRQRLSQRFPAGPRFFLELLHPKVSTDAIREALKTAIPFSQLAETAQKSEPDITEAAMRARVGRGLQSLGQCLGLHPSTTNDE